MKKRLLSMLLVLVMVIGMLPVTAMAGGHQEGGTWVTFRKVVTGLDPQYVPQDHDIDFDFYLYNKDGHLLKKDDDESFDFDLEKEKDDYDEFVWNESEKQFESKTGEDADDDWSWSLKAGETYKLTENVKYPKGYTGPRECALTLVAEPAENATLTKNVTDNSWTIVVTGPVTITAYNNYKCAPKEYTLTYNPTTGSGGPGTETVTEQSAYPLKTTPKPTHTKTTGGDPVVFIGWTAKQDEKIYTKDDTAPTCITTVDIAGNTTVYAVYGLDTNNNGTADVLEDKYTVTYQYTNTVADAPAVPAQVTGVLAGTAVNVAAVPTLAGYTFNGWKKGDVKVTTFTMPAENVTLTGTWELIPTYTLTYHVNGGNNNGPEQESNLSAQNDYPLNTTTKPTHDPVDGVRVLFVGWTAKQDTKIYAKNETAPTCITKVDIVGNTTVYAVYGYDTNGDNIPDVLQNWYTLTYDGNGATVGTVPAAPATYLTGSTVPVLGNTGNLDMTTGEGASLHNYVFAGWNTAADGTGTTYQAGDTFQINANTILYAMWELDDWNDTEDKTTGGDSIPDKYQAVVVYESKDENQGTVSLAQEVVTIKDETYPIPAAVGRLKITGSTATPKTGYVFENWTSALTFTGAKAATLAKQTIHNVEGGKTYTFTAHFDTAVPGLNITKTLKSVGGVEVASTTVAPMAKVGDEIVWIITVNNSGNCDLSNIPVKDVLKDEKGNELTGVSVRPIGTYGNYGDELGTSWTIETLPVGQTSEYIVTYKVTAADAGKTLTNSAVSGETTGNAPGVLVENGALKVVKTVDKTTAKVGDKLTYTITVTNTGNTTLYRVELTDAMLNVTETIDTLERGTSWTKSYEYTVKTADAGKTIVNTAVAKASDGTTGSGSSEGTKVQSAQIHVPTLNKKDHVAYIIGYEDNTVRPENNITRAEVATIFFRLLTDDSRARFWSQTNDFSDVSTNDWFNNAVSTMANAGVLTGYPDGTFKPNAPITRAEFAAIAARFSDVVYNGKCSFTDVAATYWAADEIALAEHLGWITGYPDDTFRPSRNITRAEAMTLINRVLERAVEEEHMLKNMVKWIDNSPNAWYYEAVQEATNSHTYTRLSKKVPGQSFYYEDWVAILENPDWAALERAWSKANDQ